MVFHSKPTTFVAQVNLKVLDLERSLTFYKEIIGFNILEQTEHTAKLTADGKTVLLEIEQPVDVIPKQQRTTGLYHFAILLPHRSDLGKILKHFLQIKYPLQGAADHLVSEAIYLADPDGNGIEVYSDREASEWTWENGEVVMPSDPLDAEDILAEVQGGSWKGLPSDTLMGHIHLHVSELEKSRKFYVEGLGFEIVSKYENHALFISDGRYHHHIALNIWNGVGAALPADNSVGLESFTLMFPDEEKRRETCKKLKQMSFPVYENNNSFVTVDPSGNKINLKV
ncbi:VOC family protein [Saliterribacillus persicus]|uniref:Catechol 2,3-dioxygenase n=1 Tax=Saliterribacillus persicus TaxID=930114 RepID=A0A368X5R2_9BACI|nr:VOC family protein [Saliterribacillus persicus]RCW63155.1 catechol 2,3-dioxygenase [Saliterribacillus persicus]